MAYYPIIPIFVGLIINGIDKFEVYVHSIKDDGTFPTIKMSIFSICGHRERNQNILN